MSLKSTKHTIVVTLLEGRHFPRKQGAAVFVQCKFNGESLSTDPVPIGNLGIPVWDTELAWDLDVRALHYLRTNRVPIKVCVFALSAQGSRKALLGNLVLDLRAAQSFPAKEIWAPLIPPPASDLSKTSWIINNVNGTRPELKLSFGSGPQGSDRITTPSSIPQSLALKGASTSPKTTIPVQHTVSNPKLPTRHISSLDSANQCLANLQIAQQSDGSYRIGDEPADKLFRLAITLVAIKYLTMLAVLPSNNKLSQPDAPLKGYFILLQLLGNNLRSQSFTDPKDPSFPEETLTFDLVLGTKDLDKLVMSLNKLPVHLCFDEQILGTSNIDFPLLFLGPDKHVIPGTHETFLDVFEDSSIDLKITNRPQIVARISMTELPTEASLDALLGDTPLSSRVSENHAQNQLESFFSPVRPPSFLSTIEETITAPHSPNQASHKHPPASSPSQAIVSPTIPGVPTHVPSSITALRHDYNNRQSPTPPVHATNLPVVTLPNPNSMALPVEPNRWHQYRFSIDIKSARDLQPPWHSANVYFKYAYGPFGTKSPFMSHPPVQLFRNSAHSEVLLNSGFCAYEFVMAPVRLRTFLDALPLEIFAVHKDIMAKDTVLGAALIDLGKVMDALKRQTVTKAGQPLNVQVLDHWANVCASTDSGNVIKVMGIRIVLCIEDFGMIEEQAPVPGVSESVDLFANSITIPPSLTIGQDIVRNPAAPHHQTINVSPIMPGPDSHAGQGFSVGLPQAVADPLHPNTGIPDRALWENAQLQLEQWRIRQEQKIDTAIRERDAEAMRELESRLKEREAEHNKKSEEYREVEKHLEKLLGEMERREHALQREEQDLVNRRTELERDFETRCARVEDTARKMDSEITDQRNRDQAKMAEIERQRSAAISERNEWEDKYRALDKQFFEVKMSAAEAVRGAPDARDLNVQVKDLNKKLDACEKRAEVYKKQRAHFKQQWLNTLAEYAQYKRDAEQAKSQRIISESILQTQRSAKHPPSSPVLIKSPIKAGQGANTSATPGMISVNANDLNEIKSELHRLRETQEHFQHSLMHPSDLANQKTSHRASTTPPNLVTSKIENVPTKGLTSDQMVRLECIIQERDLLLRSGVYTAKDHLIQEMNTRIQQLSNAAV